MSGTPTRNPPADAGRAAYGHNVRARVLERVERRLRQFLTQERTRWATVDPRATVAVNALADFIAAGGKRLRPTFCVSGYLAADGDPEDPLVVDVAAGLELLHACALVHDDVMDNSSLRRGKPTVHTRFAAQHEGAAWRGESRRFGESIAIVVGDLALVYADRLVAGTSHHARELWGELRTELIVGQSLDLLAAASASADPELARWIAVCKSGRYTIQRPLVLGAVLAGRTDLLPVFEEYGLPLGEAFQLRDDLVDAFGDSQASGKPVGLDVEQSKMTLLLALAAAHDERVRDFLSNGHAENREATALREHLAGTDVRAEVERRIDELVEQAHKAIRRASIDWMWRDELAGLAVQVAYRDR